MKIYNVSLYGLFLCAFLISCANADKKKDKEGSELEKKQYHSTKNEVNVQEMKLRPFKKELLSNGKLKARQKSLLKFRVGGTLEKLPVQNGDRVRKGQVLAKLKPFDYQKTLSSAKIAYKKAHLEFEDMLVGRGYDLKDRDSIPDNIYEMAGIRSGFLEAKNQLAQAEHDMKSTQLRAPFTGKVADLEFKPYEQVGAGSPVLTLIDERVFEVEFKLIESEVSQVEVGEPVEVLAFDNEREYRGKITSINPVVKRRGMVTVKARIKNDGKLLEGTNVKIRIQKDTPDRFVVPKSAVLLRDNHEIIFKYTKGKAFWTYILITGENSTSYSIIPDPDKSSASLKQGDTIIVSGNLNLAHESIVEIASQN